MLVTLYRIYLEINIFLSVLRMMQPPPQVKRSGFFRELNSMLKRLFNLLVGKRRG